jgi:hypothetical protein
MNEEKAICKILRRWLGASWDGGWRDKRDSEAPRGRTGLGGQRIWRVESEGFSCGCRAFGVVLGSCRGFGKFMLKISGDEKGIDKKESEKEGN